MVLTAPFSLLQTTTRTGLRRALVCSETLPTFDGTQQRRWRSSRKTGARLKPTNDLDYTKKHPSPVEIPHPDAYTDTETQNIIDKAIGLAPARRIPEEIKEKTSNFDISTRKLNDLARLIRRKPIDNAILQMEFSSKQAAVRVKDLLVLTRNKATYEGMERSKLIVDRAWVTKGMRWLEVDIRARGKHGTIRHPTSALHLVLKHGKSKAELEHEKSQAFIQKALRSGPDRLSYNRSISNMGLGRGLYGW